MHLLDIVKLTPKSNCGQCGYPSCLAFAAHVAKSGEDPAKCIYLDASSLDLKKNENLALDRQGEKHDQEFINLLKEKITKLDFASIGKKLGATLSPVEESTLNLSYLGQEVLLNQQCVLINNREPDDLRDQILLYNYVSSGGGDAPEGEWIGMENLPNSISKIKTLAFYCEEKLAQHFTNKPPQDIIKQVSKIGGLQCPTESADLSFIIKVLPKIPQKLLFWEEAPEEGFPAKVKILYDAGVMNYLDLESLVFSSERLAERILAL